MSYSTPLELRAALVALFPVFEGESDAAEAQSYHRVVMDLAPFLKSYLEGDSFRKVRAFGQIVNHLVAAGGDQQNAIETCLLEHASQVGCGRLLKPHLSDAAKREL